MARRKPKYQQDADLHALNGKVPKGIPADPSQHAAHNSYSGGPRFYEDKEFTCVDCGKVEVWTAEDQKWWYETAKGSIYTTAIRCRACRETKRNQHAGTPRRSRYDRREQLMIPNAPTTLGFEKIRLAFREIFPGDESKGFVPYYHFRIMLCDDIDVGHINFRVGDTRHVNSFAGHVGFEIVEAHRGHGYSLQACRALEPFVRTIYAAVILTCNPENIASRRTIEKLGAVFLEEVDVPPDEPMYQNGARRKRRYQWTVQDPGGA